MVNKKKLKPFQYFTVIVRYMRQLARESFPLEEIPEDMRQKVEMALGILVERRAKKCVEELQERGMI